MSEAGNQKVAWYIIQTYSGYENKVAQSIMKKAENQNLTDKILETRIPLEEVTEVTDGVKKTYSRKRYPGYVMVCMVHTDEVAYLIRSIRGVTGFLGGDPNKPTPLSPKDVQEMDDTISTETLTDLHVGDLVRIKRTAMEGMEGKIIAIDLENYTCEVLVQMFGSETPTTLSLMDVEHSF